MAAPPPLLTLQDIRLSLGTAPLLDGAELSVGAGERLALVGRNGSGKSTLLKIAGGLLEFDAGRRFLQPGATMRILAQEPDFAGFSSTLAYVEAGLAPGDDEWRAAYYVEQLGLSGREDPAHLSGGEARRAALARVLAPKPDILLLDEPTNHLDLPAISWLEEELASWKGALVIVSHDRRFLSRLSRAMVWLDRGRTRRVEQGFAHFEEWRDQVLAEEERDAHKLKQEIAREEHWLRYGVTARRKRNVRRLGGLHALREKARTRLKPLGTAKAAAMLAGESGSLVANAEGAGVERGGRWLIRDLDFRIMAGDRIAILGPNGAGKTTLLNLLTGTLKPDEGRVTTGTGLKPVTLDQKRESLDPEATVADTLTEGRGDMVAVGGEQRHVLGYMRDFLFPPAIARQPVGALSGGERGRLMLARALARPSNLLILDEPTNDLDLETLDLMEELLADYPGTVLLVSHDRDFVDRVANAVIAWEGEGVWQPYAGGYTDMVAQRGEGIVARQPGGGGGRQAGLAPVRPPEPRPAPGAGKKKLSFKQQHALATLPAQIARLEVEAAGLRARIADPALYRRDQYGFAAATQALAKAEAALAAAEEEWLALEMLREEIDG